MIVRCGRCRAELEISGPGEFICPACGTRNVVRSAGNGPLGMSESPSGLTIPGGAPAPRPQAPAPGVDWITCDACRYRFAVGQVDKVVCPNCRAEIERPAVSG